MHLWRPRFDGVNRIKEAPEGWCKHLCPVIKMSETFPVTAKLVKTMKSSWRRQTWLCWSVDKNKTRDSLLGFCCPVLSAPFLIGPTWYLRIRRLGGGQWSESVICLRGGSAYVQTHGGAEKCSDTVLISPDKLMSAIERCRSTRSVQRLLMCRGFMFVSCSQFYAWALSPH